MRTKYIKKLRLRKRSKIFFTLFIIFIMPYVYESLKELGSTASTNNISLYLCIIGWFWLLLAQFCALAIIWES